MRETLAVLVVVGFVGCGDSPPLPMSDAEACARVVGCESPVNRVEGPLSPIWRVLVERDAAGVIQIGAVHEIDVPASIGAPIGPLSGSLVLAGVDASGAPVESQYIRFADTMELEDADGERSEVDLSGMPTSIVGYVTVDAAVRSFAIVDEMEEIVHMVDAPAPGEARVAFERDGMTSALIQASALSECDHIVVLNGPADHAWNPVPENATLTPTFSQLAVVRSALGRMSALHCASITRIVFSRSSSLTTGAWVSSWVGDTVFVNADFSAEGIDFSEASLVDPHAEALLTGVFIHEAGHSLTRLLQYIRPREDGTLVGGAWAPTARTLADRTLDNARLQRDFAATWREMHESFVAQGWASNYTGETASLRPASVEDVARTGFMSHYASQDPGEDIAEYIAWPVVRRVYEFAGVEVGPRTFRRGYACEAMRGYDQPDVPSLLAAAYTKVSFLRSLGAISQADFEDCVGGMFGFPTLAQGISVFQGEGTEPRRIYSGGITTSIAPIDGDYHFIMQAEGRATFGDSDYDAVLRLEVDLDAAEENGVEGVSWPRGVFELGLTSPHDFTLRMEEAPAGNFDVTDGFVLITEASNERIIGSVFVTEAWRYQAPIPVPQTFDPPVQFRFRVDG